MDTYETRLAIYQERHAKYEQALELHSLGLGYLRIQKILGVSKYLIRDWIKGYCKPRKPQSREELLLYLRNYSKTHRESMNVNKRKSYRIHRQEISLKAKAIHLALKKLVLAQYGHGNIACVQCGESDLRCLSIDHVNGNGAKHRRSLGNRGGIVFYKWLKKERFPIGYQTLCMNCQFKRNNYTEAI